MIPRPDKLARYLDGDRPDARPRDRFVEGALFGAVFTIFTPILLFIWAAGGREITLRRGSVMRVDLLTALYPLGAIVSGALLFGLTSLARARPLRALLGAIAFLPWVAGIVMCIDGGFSVWRPLHTVTTVSVALIIGGKLGWDMRPSSREERERRSRRPAV